MKAVSESVKLLFNLLDDGCLTFLPCVTVHMGLERAGSGEAFVANLAFVLLQRARRDFGTELTHHRLRIRWHAPSKKTLWDWECPRWQVQRLGG